MHNYGRLFWDWISGDILTEGGTVIGWAATITRAAEKFLDVPLTIINQP